MRKLILLLAAVVAFSMTAFAQESSTQSTTGTQSTGGTQSTTTTTTTTTKHKHAKGEAQDESAQSGSSTSSKAGGTSAKEQQLTGCIAKDASGSKYMLTNGHYKQGVELNSSEDLSAHVGHQVKLMGTWQKPTEEAAGGAGAKGHQMRTFNATSVKHVSDTCPAGAAAGKKSKSSKSEAPKNPGF